MLHAHLFSGQQTFGPQPVIAALLIKGLPNMSNFLEIERCVLPGPSTLLVQNLGHLAITVLIQEPVDPATTSGLVLRIWAIGNGFATLRLRVAPPRRRTMDLDLHR